MKTKRIYRKGFAALALILALAACADPVRPGTDETIPQGMGLARIQLGTRGGTQNVVRTVLPGIGGYYFTLEFTAPGKTPVNKTLDGEMSVTVALEPAVWTLEVKGYTNSSMTVLKVRGSISVPITAGTESSFDVYLTPDFNSGGTGTLNYNISFPASVRAVFGMYPIDDTPGTSHETDISASAGGTATGTLSDLPEGAYMAVIELYDGAGNRAAAQTEAAHIYDGLTTTLTRSFSATDFAACLPEIGGTTLAARLDAALASPSGSYTIVLNGTEGDLAAFAPKTLNVTDGKSITITIRGGGNEVQVDRTGTPLFTLGADTGSSLSLTIQDLTLRGQSDNSVPVVQVNQRGTLLMKTSSLITGNTTSSSAGGVEVYYNGTFTMNGGGAAVSGGTFAMNGGAVSGNTLSSPGGGGGSFRILAGGGVLVASGGTFTMNGGAVSGNTISFSSYGDDVSRGGGVEVYGGTFTMNGGAVSGNISSGYRSIGGGVFVTVGIFTKNGTFTMNGGVVSGNTSSSSGGDGNGGGVYSSGTFAMNSGTISGNTASSNGGGVFVAYEGSNFTMSGGTISGNTASTGGGVCAYSNGTFTKQFGGVIYGSDTSNELKNTATDGDNYGHAAYVDSSPTKIRNTTAGTGVTLDSARDGAAGGWE
jgi:parallel beta-helix repeat protein